MKTWMLALSSLFIVMVAGSSCTTHRKTVIVQSKPLPPGQAKKITGSQSAKPYAPGQRKKHKH